MRPPRLLRCLVFLLNTRVRKAENQAPPTTVQTVLFWLLCTLLSLSAIAENTDTNPTLNAEKNTVISAVFHDLPPSSYLNNGQIVGIDYEIINSIAKEMGLSFKALIVPNRRRLALIANGDADLVTVAMPADNNALYPANIQLDQQVLYQFEASAITLKTRRHVITSRSELDKLRIGHLRVPKELEDAVIPNHPHRTRFNTIPALLKGLLTGRIDALLAPPPEIWFEAKKLGVEDRLQVNYKLRDVAVYPAWSDKGLGITHPDIRQQFTNALEKLKREGKIASILKKYSQLKYFSHYGIELPKSLPVQ